MTRFDDNLWREVERRYGAELSNADGPLSSGPRRRVPVIAGASLGVAGASAAAVIVLSAASSPPAFAVTTHRDGTVSVVIRRIDGIPGANHRLAQLGIRVRAVQVDAQCQAVVAPALKQVTIANLKRDHGAGWVGGVAGGVKARIRPQQIARNHTLVIAAVPSKGQVRLVRGRSVRGAIPVCLPPVALVRSVTRGGKPEILSCGIRHLPLNHRIVVAPPANTTATNETTSTGPAKGWTKTTAPQAPPATATVTTPTPATATATATATGTGTGTSTATGSGTTTGSETTQSPASGGPFGVKAPPILQACVAAARRAQADQRARTSAGASR
jgi:hypothetical protein